MTNTLAYRIRRRAFKWRLTTIHAGLLLAATFFMPAIDSCRSPVVPSESAADLLEFDVTTGSVPELIMWSACFILPYLIGLLAALAALARMLPRDRRVHAMAFSTLIAMSAIVAVNSIWLTFVEIRTRGILIMRVDVTDAHTAAIFLVCPVWFLMTLALSSTRRGRRWLCPTFALSFWLLAWFTSFLLNSSRVYYGLWLSVLAAIALLIATIGEAAALSDQSIPRTLWQLLTCRIRLAEEVQGRCRHCGYLLHGLPEPRCPECGRPFVPDDDPRLAPSRATG